MSNYANLSKIAQLMPKTSSFFKLRQTYLSFVQVCPFIKFSQTHANLKKIPQLMT
jgi:hypothetical protein